MPSTSTKNVTTPIAAERENHQGATDAEQHCRARHEQPDLNRAPVAPLYVPLDLARVFGGEPYWRKVLRRGADSQRFKFGSLTKWSCSRSIWVPSTSTRNITCIRSRFSFCREVETCSLSGTPSFARGRNYVSSSSKHDLRFHDCVLASETCPLVDSLLEIGTVLSSYILFIKATYLLADHLLRERFPYRRGFNTVKRCLDVYR